MSIEIDRKIIEGHVKNALTRIVRRCFYLVNELSDSAWNEFSIRGQYDTNNPLISAIFAVPGFQKITQNYFESIKVDVEKQYKRWGPKTQMYFLMRLICRVDHELYYLKNSEKKEENWCSSSDIEHSVSHGMRKLAEEKAIEDFAKIVASIEQVPIKVLIEDT